MSNGSDNLPQFMEDLTWNSVRPGPHNIIQHIVRQNMESNSTRRSLSEEESPVQRKFRNNDDDEFDGINVPNAGKSPPVPTSGPTIRTFEENSTKNDNSVRKSGKTNISSSYNMRGVTIRNSFRNSSILVDSPESESTPPGETTNGSGYTSRVRVPAKKRITKRGKPVHENTI